MTKYPTTYTDDNGSVTTTIFNHFNGQSDRCLFLEIEGVQFKAWSFDDFELINPENYSNEQLERFTFNKVGIMNSDKVVYELCNCKIQIKMPISLIDIRDNSIIKNILNINLQLGKPANNGGIDFEEAFFEIVLNGTIYKAKGDMFELGLERLKKQFADNYYFRNCFGCLYGDYSPYGNGFYGDMQCFRNNKEEYLKADTKFKLLDLAEKGVLNVQETYYCHDFEIRKPNTGYRG